MHCVSRLLIFEIDKILHDCVAYVEHRNAKTVSVHDVIFSLKRIGQPIYGFDPETNKK